MRRDSRRKNNQLRRRDRWLDRLVAAAFLLVVAVLAAAIGGLSGQVLEGYVRVSDGDSLRINDRRVRLRGIDAPELEQKCGRLETIDCGRKSRDHLRKLVRSSSVACEGWEVDQFDRLLVDCRAGQMNLNREMVRSGWATAYGDFEPEEDEARGNKRGIWAFEFIPPRDWRRDRTLRLDGDSQDVDLRKLVRSAWSGIRSRMGYNGSENGRE